MTPLNELTATEIVQAIGAGKATCEEVTRACLEHIAAREPQVQAWQYLNPDLALERARALDRRGTVGPLKGVPVAMKDVIDTCDMPTEYGSPIHKGHRPRIDAVVVALTRRAGGVIMGKAVTTEFASRYAGKTRNPKDYKRTPGGSSSGSAAAVSDNMVPLALGTQTTASTIRPASFCGCVGYRPTWGEIRCHGVMEGAGSLDTVGIITRSVEDVSLYRDVLAGIKPEPLPKQIGAAPRIAFCRTHIWNECEPQTKRLLEECASKLAKAGAKVVDMSLPHEFERIADAHRCIADFEMTRNRAWEIDNHWDMISETLRNHRLKEGVSCSFEAYRDARAFAERSRLVLDDLFADYDVILSPAVDGEAPVGLSATGSAAFCAIWTTMHVPAMTLPLFTGPNGLPIGAQLTAKRGDDCRLFEAARWVWRAAF